MKTRILLICSVVLALAVLLLLRRGNEPGKGETVEIGEAKTNQSSQPAHPVNVEQRPDPAASIESNTPAMAAVSDPIGPKTTNAYYQELLAEWQVPIEFYGKVVDENSNAVPEANVRFRWIETPTEEGEKMSTNQSDSAGLFSLHGKRGRSLTVWVSKDGYYASHGGQSGFVYALGSKIHSPNPDNPVIFNLKKKGTLENLVVVKRTHGMPRDGVPVSLDLFTGKTTTEADGGLVIQCWTDDRGKQRGEKYDWHSRVTIPGGGLVISDKEFDFIAPEEGYVPFIEVNMPADRSDWRNDVDLKFFYRLSGGAYGRMTLSLIAGGGHFFVVESFLNPSGSRNLESSVKGATRPSQ